MRHCSSCRKSFQPRGPRHKYCSPQCARNGLRTNFSHNNKAKCCGCGKTFCPRGADRSKYCSMDCYWSNHGQAWQLAISNGQHKCLTSWMSCVVCHAQFVSRNKNARTCQPQCLLAYNRLRNRLNERKSKAKLCVICGRLRTNEYHSKWCSESCRREYRKRQKIAANLLRKQTRRRREAIKRGVRHERYNASDIYSRDNWMCGLCGKPIWKRAKVPHAKAATIDHIVPLSRGGDDVRSNVQAAHFICNSTKNNKMIGQLRMIG